jgi:hypothetical protein
MPLSPGSFEPDLARGRVIDQARSGDCVLDLEHLVRLVVVRGHVN